MEYRDGIKRSRLGWLVQWCKKHVITSLRDSMTQTLYCCIKRSLMSDDETAQITAVPVCRKEKGSQTWYEQLDLFHLKTLYTHAVTFETTRIIHHCVNVVDSLGLGTTYILYHRTMSTSHLFLLSFFMPSLYFTFKFEEYIR